MAGSKSKRAITYTNKKGVHYRTPLAVWTGLEPATPCVTGMYSNQLNYHTIFYVLLSFPDCECKGSTFFYTYKSFCCFLIKKKQFLGYVVQKQTRFNGYSFLQTPSKKDLSYFMTDFPTLFFLYVLLSSVFL